MSSRRSRSDGNVIGRGLINDNHTPKPAFPVLPYTIDFTNGLPVDHGGGDLAAYVYSWPRTARQTAIVWRRDGGVGTARIAVPSGWMARTVRFPEAELLAGHCCATEQLPVRGGAAEVTVTGEATFVEVVPPQR